jgi:hypothetical protein
VSRRALAALSILASAVLACGEAPDPHSCAIPGTKASATCAPAAPSTGSSTEARLLLAPGSFSDGAVEVTLAAGERAAVFVLNAGGSDGAAAHLETRGVSAPPLSGVRQALDEAPPPQIEPRPFAPGDGGVLEATRSLSPLLSLGASMPRGGVTAFAAPPARTSFCVLATSSYAESARRHGTLLAQGAQVLVYVDETALGEVTIDEAARLADAFDRRIHPALSALLGPPSDVDANGKVILFLTALPQIWGYYWASDVVFPRDLTDACTGSRSNGADALYLTLPSAVTRLGWTRAQALEELIPGVLAHEYAHLLSFQRRCLARRCSGADETWIEEGLAKVAEDEAGYGWNLSRGAGIAYLTRTREDLFRGYDGRSLTRWEGDSVGNYEGAHAFFRFHADRIGPGLLAALTSGRTGVANVEQALGTSFPEALADVATALLFSDAAASPAADYSFTGAGWTPLGEKLRRLETVPLGDGLSATASLRADGWNAFLTGPAGAEGGAVRVTSSEPVKPWIAVVRFRGEL